MKRSVHAALCAVVLCLSAQVFAEDIIIESRKEGQNFDRYKEIEGAWIDSQTPPTVAKSSAPGLTDPTRCGTRKFMFSGPGGDIPPLAAARFSPMLTSPGHFHVYATWPRGANATPVYYTIKHAKGEEKKTLTQDGWSLNGNSNIWHSLGDYDFNSGPDQYVEVRIGPDAKRMDPKNFGQLYADAIRFNSQPLAQTKGDTFFPGLNDSAAGTGGIGTTGGTSGQTATLPTLTADTAPLKWYDDIGSAQSLANQENKKILVLFYSPQSANSKYYEDEAFQNPQVKSLLKSGYILARINFVENTDLAYKLGVFKAGTINIYNSRGSALDQIGERLMPTELATKLRSY